MREALICLRRGVDGARRGADFDGDVLPRLLLGDLRLLVVELGALRFGARADVEDRHAEVEADVPATGSRCGRSAAARRVIAGGVDARRAGRVIDRAPPRRQTLYPRFSVELREHLVARVEIRDAARCRW